MPHLFAKKTSFRTLLASLVVGLSVSLAGCTGSGSGTAALAAAIFGGWSVDGPALSLPFDVFTVDLSAADGQSATSVSSATSDAATGAMSVSVPTNTAPVIVKGTADASTKDLSTCTDVTNVATCAAPYFSSMRSAITRAVDTANATTPVSFQMNPMTTLTVAIAVAKSNAAAADPAAEFEAQLANAANLVMSTFGSGMTAATYDLFTSPTVIEPGMTTQQQLDVAFYRSRLLHLNAIVKGLVDGSALPAPTPDAMLAAIAADLADNGVLDASAGGLYTLGTIAVALATDPSTTPVPDTATAQTPADVVAILTAEAAVTAPAVVPDFTGFVAALAPALDSDSDGDGVLNSVDPLPNNAPPVANADAYTVNEGATLNVALGQGVTSNDVDTDTLTAILISNVTNGVLTLNADGSFSYVHDGTETTADSFTYKANDGSQDSATVTVSLTVTPVNDAPVAVADTYGTSEGGVLNVAKAQGVLDTNDTDAEGNSLTAVLDTDVVNGTLTLNADGSFAYTHNGSETTQDTFTYHANDGALDSGIVTVTINVTPVNDAPVAVADTYAVNEGATLTVVKASGVIDSNDTDAEATALTAVKVTDPAHGALTLNADGSFTYVHNGDHVATDSFTYKANDGAADSATVTVTINVTLLDDAPVAVNDGYGLSGAGASVVVVANDGVLSNDTDEEGDARTANLLTPPSHHVGVFTLNADGSFTYNHDNSATTVDTFTYNVTAGGKTSNTATVTIAVNQPPGVVADAYSVDEGGTLTKNAATGVESNDPADADGDATTVVKVSDPAHGTLTLAADGSFTYVHDGGEDITDSFTYRRNDGSQNGPIGTVTITINPINDAPVAVADSLGPVLEGGTLTLATRAAGVLNNDSDADDVGTFTAVLVQDVANGTLTLNADGSLVYVHNGSETTSDSFTYKPNDGTVDGNTVTVSIAITPQNDTPSAVNDSSLQTAINVALQIDVLANDSDAEDGAGSNLTIVSVQSAANGAGKSTSNQTVTTDGSTVTYTPANDFFGADSFTYTVQDAGGLQSMATVSITVNAFPVDISGVWKTGLTATAASNPANCGFGVGDTLTVFMGIRQLSNALTVYTHMNDKMTGTITDNSSSSYPMAVSDALNETAISATYDSVTDSFSGTLSITETGCTGAFTMAASSKIRGAVGDPTKLSGLFGLELGTALSHSERTAETLQADVFNATTAQIYVAGGRLNVSEFDPISGYFEGSLDEGGSATDLTGDAVNDTYRRQTEYAGILITDSTSDTCGSASCTTPAIALFREEKITRGLGGSGVPAVTETEFEGYGMRISSSAGNLVRRSEAGTGTSVLALYNPPLDAGGIGNALDQTLTMKDGANAQICSASFNNNLGLVQEIPRPAFSFNAPMFQSKYAIVSCSVSLATVADNAAFKAEVTDGGFTETFNATANVGALPGNGPARADMNVNNMIPSQSMKGGTIPLFGFFDMADAMSVSGLLPGGGSTPSSINIQLRQSDLVKTALGYVQDWRVAPTAALVPNFSITGGTLSSEGVRMRLQSIHNDATGLRIAATDWLIVQQGFTGAAQTELDSASNLVKDDAALEFGKFQTLLMTDPLGLGKITMCARPADVPTGPSANDFGCDPAASPKGTTDFANNKVTVKMRDNTGDYAAANLFNLNLTFTDAMTFTPELAGGVPASITGAGQVVNPEVKLVSMAYTNGDHATSLSLLNPFYQLFGSATLHLGSSATVLKTIWDDAAAPTGDANYGARFTVPLDGVAAQTVGGFQSTNSRVKGTGDTRLAAGTYQVRLVPKAGVPVTGWTFEKAYTMADATPLDAPERTEISVNGTLLSDGSVTNEASTATDALEVGATAFTFSWVSTAPANTEWSIIMKVWDAGDGSQAGANPLSDVFSAQIQTRSLGVGDPELSFNAGSNTWTWENNDLNSLFGGAVAFPNGLYAKVFVRAVDPAASSRLQTINANSENFWIKHSTVPTSSTASVVYNTATELGALRMVVNLPAGVLMSQNCTAGNNGSTLAINAASNDLALLWATGKTGPFDVMSCAADIAIGAKTPAAGDYSLTISEVTDVNSADLSGSITTADFTISVVNN